MNLVMRLCDPVIVLDHGARSPRATPTTSSSDPRVLDAYLGVVSAVLAIEGLVAGYGQGDILRGVNLALEPGTITCVIGPNGAGKSTVLKAVSGLLRPRRGTITLSGEPIGGLSPRRVLEAGVVHVPQERSLFPLMTVFENVLVGGHVLARLGARPPPRARRSPTRFPLVAERRHARAGSLSGGEQKIVEIARALMLEPTADPHGRAVDGAGSAGARAGLRHHRRAFCSTSRIVWPARG